MDASLMWGSMVRWRRLMRRRTSGIRHGGLLVSLLGGIGLRAALIVLIGLGLRISRGSWQVRGQRAGGAPIMRWQRYRR